MVARGRRRISFVVVYGRGRELVFFVFPWLELHIYPLGMEAYNEIKINGCSLTECSCMKEARCKILAAALLAQMERFIYITIVALGYGACYLLRCRPCGS